MKKEDFTRTYVVIFCSLSALIFYTVFAEKSIKQVLMKEGGVIESLTAIGYFVCLIFFLVFCKNVKAYWSFAYIFLAAGLRELDFHDRFTSMSITSTKYWFKAEAGLFERFVCACILIALISCVIVIVRRYLRSFLAGLKFKNPISIAVFFGLLFGILSKIADDGYGKLEDLNVGMEKLEILWIFEECMELGIPIMILLAILAYYKSKSSPLGPDSGNTFSMEK